jgi:multisubunit Na+/H+ antiporter MnhE subunit
MKFIRWIAGAFEDQAGTASSKRFVLYICLFFMWMLVNGSLDGKPIDQEILFTIGALILFCVGAITSEFLMKMYTDKKKE